MEDLLPGSGAVVHNVQQAHVAPRLQSWGFQVWEGQGSGGRGAQPGITGSWTASSVYGNIFHEIKKKVFSTNFSYSYDYVHMVVIEPYKIWLFFLHVP